MASAGEPDVDRDHGRSSRGGRAYDDEWRKLRAHLAAPGTVVARRRKSCGVWRRRLPPGDGAGQRRAGGVAVAQRRARRGRWRICDLDCGQGWTLARELRVPGGGGRGSIGDGPSFAYAWFHDWPW